MRLKIKIMLIVSVCLLAASGICIAGGKEKKGPPKEFSTQYEIDQDELADLIQQATEEARKGMDNTSGPMNRAELQRMVSGVNAQTEQFIANGDAADAYGYIGGKRYKSLLKQYKDQTEGKASATASGKNLYIFISSSIPTDTLTNYMKEAEGVEQVIFVLRGMVGGVKYLKPTIEFFKQFGLNHEKDDRKAYMVSVIIDPSLFRKYRIQSVPAFLFDPYSRERVENAMAEVGKTGNRVAIDKPVDEKTYFLAYGDMSIEYMAGLLNREAKSKDLATILKNIEGKGFHSK